MNTHWRQWIRFGVPALVTLVLIGAVALVSPPASMRVTGLAYVTYPESPGDGRTTRFAHVTVELTNASPRPMTYWSFGDKHPMPNVEFKSPQGWVSQELYSMLCGNGLQFMELKPGEAVSFTVTVQEEARPCRVAVHFSDSRPSRWRQWLPGWIAKRVSWGDGHRKVTTAPLDLRTGQGAQVRLSRT